MRVIGLVVSLGLLLAGCGAPAAVAPSGTDPPGLVADPGAEARAAVLARYAASESGDADLRPPALPLVAATTPQVLADAAPVGAAPVTPEPTPTADAEPSGAGPEAPVADGEPAPAETGGAGAVAPSPRYVLPPHTAGLLRINPRRLPAVPVGTELTGLASWYGPGFHGRRTACGGVYDQNGATLATRELRCGTVVRITGPTGLTVEATVTDWGPAEWAGRRFDLSAAVFNAIAPLSRGVVPVRVITANVPP